MSTYRVEMDSVQVDALSPDEAVRLIIAGAAPTFRVVELMARVSMDQGAETIVNTIFLAERPE